VTGDAYIDHPSFGMAIIGRLLEAQGFRVGIIAQPDWTSADAFKALGKPNLFFGVTAGNMDSMVNHYTSDRRLRHNDSYTPDGEGGKRPDRAVMSIAQRCREAYRDAPIVLGGIEASLRRIAQYDHWSEKVRRSVLVDAKADLLIYGNAERASSRSPIARPRARSSARDPRHARHRLHAGPRAGRLHRPVARPGRRGRSRTADDSLARWRRRIAAPRPDRLTCRTAMASGRRTDRATRAKRRAMRHADRGAPAGLRAGQGRQGALCPCLAHPASGEQSRETRGRWSSAMATSKCG
jgi:hypothetical protein